MDKIVLALLQKSNIKNINREELKLQISSHPSYPSLHAITGVLDHFGIENMALDVPQNEDVYGQLPPYFIAHLKNEESEEIAFIEKNNSNVTITYTDKKNKKLSKENFLKNWSGIVVMVEKEELSEKRNTKDLKILKYVPIVLLVSIIGLSYFNTTVSLFHFSHLLVSILGVYVSYLIVKHSLGFNSKTVDKFCSSTKKTSCDAVINSNGAKLFGLFTLSDISFVYFLSITVSWFAYNVLSIFNYNVIVMLSLLAIPVIIYSIVYQGFIVKKWCPLCLTTAGILTCQAIMSYFMNPLYFNVETKGFFILMASALFVITIYILVKSLIREKLYLGKEQVAYYKFKRKFTLFNSLYSQNPTLDTSLGFSDEIVFGNKNANIEIVVITNPMCHFCKATHQAIENLLKTNDKNIKVTIRFNINTENKEDVPYKIATALVNIYQKYEKVCREAMHQVYTEGVDVNKWLSTYGSHTKKNQFQLLEAEKNWCTTNNINFTPAVYVNNKEFPKEYDLSDLQFFMDDLLEQMEGYKEKYDISEHIETAI